MKPKELLFAHRYTEAVAAHQDHLRSHPEQNYYPGLGDALLSLSRYAEAREAFARADEIESRRTRGSLPWVKKIGAALWLSGDRKGGMSEWHRGVAGILSGEIIYGDLAGGATQGLLLWYAAITLGDQSERNYALDNLGRKARRKNYGALCWPRPIVLMVLDKSTLAEVLQAGAGSRNAAEAVELARNDLLKRRHLSQALFYAASLERALGREHECIEMMRTCSELENPILEVEWYLARGEMEASQQ